MKHSKSRRVLYRYIYSVGKGDLFKGWNIYRNRFHSQIDQLLTYELSFPRRSTFVRHILLKLDIAYTVSAYVSMKTSIDTYENCPIVGLEVFLKVNRILKALNKKVILLK